LATRKPSANARQSEAASMQGGGVVKSASPENTACRKKRKLV